MSDSPPCIRHGVKGVADPRLLHMLDIVRREDPAIAGKLISLLDHDGRLWATWRDDKARRAGSTLLTRAWAETGGEDGALHLIRSDDDYDYQEDCMNDASS